MALGIIGIVIALLVFLYGAYKNVSTLYLAPIAGVIVAVTNGINATQAFTEYYIGVVEENVHTGAFEIGGVTGMILAVFPTIFLGALFGKVLTDCGAAGSIANVLTSKLIMSAEGRGQREAGETCSFVDAAGRMHLKLRRCRRICYGIRNLPDCDGDG